MAAKIKKGDRVVLLTGKDKGRTGQVDQGACPRRAACWSRASTWSSATPARSQGDPQGGIKHKEARVHVSNVAIVDSAGKPTRVGFRVEDGKKVRVAKTTGEVIHG